MKTLVGALAIASLCMTPLASAQDDCCPLGPPAAAAPNTQLTIQDEDDDKVFGEVELLLNKVLLVDETGRIVMRKEFRNSLPIPAERVEGMLGQFVELGDDGKLHIKDREAVRPYLPMIRGFLGNGLNRLQDLQKLPEDERREAMKRLFGNRGQDAPEEQPRAEAPKPEEKPEARPERGERRMARREREREHDDDDDDDRPRLRRDRDGAPRGRRAPARRDRDGARAERGGTVEQRLSRIERQLGRIERMLAEGGGRGRARGNQGPGGFLRRLFEGRGGRGFDRDGLRDLFERGRGRGRDRSDRDRSDRDRSDRGRRGAGDLFERGRTWRNGLRRLFELMEPEDFSALRDGLGALAKGGLEGDAMRDPGKLMEKLQKELSPEDTVRFMEIFSEFMGTPEGRAFAGEMEDTVSRLGEFMNSEQGERLGEMMRQFQGSGGNRGELRDRLEQLLGGRGRRDRADRDEHEPSEKRSARRHDRPANPPSGSKLY